MPSSNEVAWPNRGADLLAVATVAMLAAGARFAVSEATPPSLPVSDMAEYWARAVHLYEHGALFPDSWRMPGLPVALAAAFAVAADTSVDAARGLNILAGAFSTVLTYWLARRTSPVRWSLIAASIVAIYPSLIVYTTFVATESVVLVPLLGALIAATYPTRIGFGSMGLLTGLAILVRPASVSLVPGALLAAAICPPNFKRIENAERPSGDRASVYLPLSVVGAQRKTP